METGNAIVPEYPLPILILSLNQRRRLLPVPPPTGDSFHLPGALLPSLRDEGATGTSRDPQACSLRLGLGSPSSLSGRSWYRPGARTWCVDWQAGLLITLQITPCG